MTTMKQSTVPKQVFILALTLLFSNITFAHDDNTVRDDTLTQNRIGIAVVLGIIFFCF